MGEYYPPQFGYYLQVDQRALSFSNVEKWITPRRCRELD
jgi:hypothetical protein